MPKIYIDTNIFIDFYQSSSDPVGVVDTIAEYASHLVIPEQTVNEFHRNRIGVLHELAKNFSKS
jgi:rRNA-processing protein FCF1